MFKRCLSPLTLVNQVALTYFHNARDQRLSLQVQASTNKDLADWRPFQEMQRSVELYGERPGKDVQASYVNDDASAQHIAGPAVLGHRAQEFREQVTETGFLGQFCQRLLDLSTQYGRRHASVIL